MRFALAEDFRHNGLVSAILYPIAADASGALDAPRGRAARESDAARLTNEPVSFAREFTGPAYRTEDEARAAWAGRLDGPGSTLQPQDRFCELKPIAQRSRIPFTPAHTVWRLSVAYWRIGAATPTVIEAAEQARQARRSRKGSAPDSQALGALAQQPLRPIKPQQPLDVGLFEVRMPEDPSRLMPDE